jgi:predicted nucleic acid-binding protein
MAFKPSVTVLDACILYPFHLRNIVVQAAVDRLVEARWSDEIHDEWVRNLTADVPAIPVERLRTTRRLMNDALPRATVSGYADLVATVSLPDPGDRHVFATAIAAGASIILTWNLQDFPATALEKYGVRSQTPDAFLAGLYDEVPDLAVGSLANARRNLNKSRVSASSFVDILRNQRLIQFAKRIEKHLASI